MLLRQLVLACASLSAGLFGVAHAVTIGFEGLADGTLVTNQFPEVTFSSTAGSANFVSAQPGLGIGNNFICTGPSGGGINCTAETILNFISPVSGLTFYQVGDNATGVIAKVDVFVNSVFAATVDIMGFNDPFVPNLVDLTAFANITSIRLHSITDPAGLGWDEFSFNAANAIPLPAAFWLFLAGLGGLFARRRSKIS